MSVPVAIIIAGALVAGAVYFSNVNPRQISPQAAPAISVAPTPAPASLDIAPITSEDHIRGSQNAKITILEYSDLECPFCKVFHQSMVRAIQDYPDKIRWIYRHAPIASNHPKAFAEENASECAAAQGKFWEFTDVIFANTPSNNGLNLDDLPKYAKQAGVADIPAFQKCVTSDQFKAKVEADLQDGIKAGLEGTPFNMIIKADGTKVQLGGGVPYGQLKGIIDGALK